MRKFYSHHHPNHGPIKKTKRPFMLHKFEASLFVPPSGKYFTFIWKTQGFYSFHCWDNLKAYKSDKWFLCNPHYCICYLLQWMVIIQRSFLVIDSKFLLSQQKSLSQSLGFICCLFVYRRNHQTYL